MIDGDDPVQVEFECKEVDPMRRMRVRFHTRSAVQSALQTFLSVLIRSAVYTVVHCISKNDTDVAHYNLKAH